MPPSRKVRGRRARMADPRETTQPPSPFPGGDLDSPPIPSNLFEHTTPYWSYSLEGDRVDEHFVGCYHASVAECVLNALMLGPGDYIVRRNVRHSPLWHFRVTEGVHRDALRSLADLLARLHPGMPRHLPEPRT